jgi:hypothetical protein
MRHGKRLTAALALVLLAALVVPVAASAADGPSTFVDYHRRVNAAYDYGSRALPDAWRTERSAQDAAAQINTYLPGAEEVRVGTRTIDVDNSILRSLVARLDSSKSAPERRDTVAEIQAHLGSLKLAVDEGSGAAPSDRALLGRLLARSDLSSRPTVADAFAKLIDRITQWLTDWFARLMRRKGAATASDVGLGIVFVALAALLVFAAVQVIRSISASVARHDERILAERAADAAVVSAAEGLPPDALGYAEQLAAEGRFREAVRALFGGAARTLVDLGLLRSTRTRTNAELLADLEPVAPPVLPPLTTLSDDFERAWYGHADPGEAGFDAARERYRESLRSAQRLAEQRQRASEEASM